LTALQATDAARSSPLGSRDRPAGATYGPWLLAILAGLLAARTLALIFGRTDLFFDETQYWVWSRELAFGYFTKPPLIGWIIRGATEICGNAEWCVRAPSPILYTITSLLVFLTGRALYGERIGFWSAIVFATLPAASLSSLIISTDVPLLLFWTIALYAWIKLIETGRMSFAVLVGIGIGTGLLAKYAAIYFVFCMAIDALSDRRARDALRGGRGIVAGAIALALIAPNLIWNATHGFVTFSHTAENAGWKGLPIHLGAVLEFLGSQFAVFGPILFAVLIYLAWATLRRGCAEPQCRLLAFSVPVILLLTLQALLSRAFANWAAVAYPAATILVTAALLAGWPRLFRISLWLHIGAAVAITIGPLFAPNITAITGPDWSPYGRMLGWRELADSTGRLAKAEGAKSVLTDNREVTGELLYYLRDETLPISLWFRDAVPRNHFEMTHPFRAAAPQPVLYVTLLQSKTSVLKSFDETKLIANERFPRDNPVRAARFFLLRGYSW
jgi:4-amino-4-deoxy-L-arabinose transferase-like glycosyltransferase